MQLAALRPLNHITVAGHRELVGQRHCSKDPSTCQLCTNDGKCCLAKQCEPLSEQGGADAHPCTPPNHFRIEIAQFVVAEDHPPKVREASFFVVVAFADIEKRRERPMVFYLLEDSVHDQRNALPTPRVRRATFRLGH
jgi:hypothetical protein